MKITKEYLQENLKELKKQHDQHIANANAVSGALQVYEQLLSYLELECEPSFVSPQPETGSQPSDQQ